jgi:hypothetical protein
MILSIRTKCSLLIALAALPNSPQHIALRVERLDLWGNLAALFALH